MKIIYISDIHGCFDALAGLPSADLLVVGGDFTQFGSLDDFRNAVDRVAAVSSGFLAVAGNLDVPEGDAVLMEGGHLLSVKEKVRRGGLVFVGISGANRSPFNTPYEWEDDAMESALSHFDAGSIDVLVTHAPPFETGADTIGSGANVGSRAVRKLLERVRPAAVLCGHIHEARGIYDFEGIPVVNPGAFGEEGNYAEIRMDAKGRASAWLAKVR